MVLSVGRSVLSDVTLMARTATPKGSDDPLQSWCRCRGRCSQRDLRYTCALLGFRYRRSATDDRWDRAHWRSR